MPTDLIDSNSTTSKRLNIANSQGYTNSVHSSKRNQAPRRQGHPDFVTPHFGMCREWLIDYLQSIAVSALSKSFNLLSTSPCCKFISSTSIDSAALQASSSLNASVHRPSTKFFTFPLLKTSGFVRSKNGNMEGRMRKCNHFGCFSSIFG